MAKPKKVSNPAPHEKSVTAQSAQLRDRVHKAVLWSSVHNGPILITVNGRGGEFPQNVPVMLTAAEMEVAGRSTDICVYEK